VKAPFTFSPDRFTLFSDAVFAIAITLLVLKFTVPPLPARPSEAQQAAALLVMWPQFLVYFIGFATIGIVWINHHAQFRYIRKITHGMVIANLLLLAFVALIPLPTEALEKVGITRTAVVFYGLTLTAIIISYGILYLQILAAHPGTPKRFPLIGLIGYPLATVFGYFVPVGGLIAFAILAGYAMLPGTVQVFAVRPADATNEAPDTK
jgi:TMEM175 potassium channel family protein